MPTQLEIAERIWNIFSRPTPALRKQFLLNPSVPGLVAGEEPILQFSDFVRSHVQRALNIKQKMDEHVRAGQTEESGMTAALDFFESLFNRENPDLLFYALQFFLVHYKGNLKFIIPSLIKQEPELVTPSAVPGGLPFAVGSTNETKLDWFRESPSVNEHHRHWHIVYRESNIDRQGEMFLYMHQQMIARYDTERIAENVPRVKPFNNFSNAIAVGYAPGPDERLSGFITSGRQPNQGVNPQGAQWQQNAQSEIASDINSGEYDPANDTLSDEIKSFNRLGCTLEPSDHPDTDQNKSYLGYHGQGHGVISDINDGVMKATVTAVRDVVFWEWHKGIDDFYFQLQERMDPYNFAGDAPPVLLRKAVDGDGNPYSADIILISGSGIPSAEEAQQAFGGNNWNADFESGTFSYVHNAVSKTVKTTNTLGTRFRQAMIRYNSPSSGQLVQYPYSYLSHDPFAYFIRVENTPHCKKR